ncbi:hypothetical protein K438DRAFT_1289257 [Mycena galopus ATCC 62051]|nr:hypothetical protein K438DRAFT_1289257 [Mycena galopus ATCC 62051]
MLSDLPYSTKILLPPPPPTTWNTSNTVYEPYRKDTSCSAPSCVRLSLALDKLWTSMSGSSTVGDSIPSMHQVHPHRHHSSFKSLGSPQTASLPCLHWQHSAFENDQKSRDSRDLFASSSCLRLPPTPHKCVSNSCSAPHSIVTGRLQTTHRMRRVHLTAPTRVKNVPLYDKVSAIPQHPRLAPRRRYLQSRHRTQGRTTRSAPLPAHAFAFAHALAPSPPSTDNPPVDLLTTSPLRRSSRQFAQFSPLRTAGLLQRCACTTFPPSFPTADDDSARALSLAALVHCARCSPGLASVRKNRVTNIAHRVLCHAPG